jgi:hypothetical protein
MPARYPLRQVLGVAPALVAMLLVASGCRSSVAPGSAGSESVEAPNAAAADDGDSGGLPTKPVDGGEGTKDEDSGEEAKDAGLGTKDAGLGTQDAAEGADDAGSGTTDAAGGTGDGGQGAEDAGTPATDAGGADECLACAEERCGFLATTCVNSPTCAEEGKCDLMCLEDQTSGNGLVPFHAPNPQCFQACTKDLRAHQELVTAATCAFALCPKECHGILAMF